MAQEVRRFSIESDVKLPPVAVVAHWLGWDDVWLALENGAAGYMLENQDAFVSLDEMLLCTARGGSCLAPP
ncbi:hypothetical protein ACWGLG_46235 [Streptomyces antimycoticus]